MDSPGGLHARPTKEALSKWLVDEWVVANASQSSLALIETAPTCQAFGVGQKKRKCF